MNIVDLPPDERSVAGFEAHRRRMERRQNILVRRTLPWHIRKSAALKPILAQARMIARHYMNLEHP